MKSINNAKVAKGTPDHAAAFLEALRATTRFEWTRGAAEAWTAPAADGLPPALIVHAPGLGYLLLDDVQKYEGVSWDAANARYDTVKGEWHTRAEGEVFPTLEAAQAEALRCRVYEAAIQGAEAEGIPGLTMEAVLDGRPTGGNVRPFRREA